MPSLYMRRFLIKTERKKRKRNKKIERIYETNRQSRFDA